MKSEYPTMTKVFLKRLGVEKCHSEMFVSNKLNDRYMVLCSFCMRRECIAKEISNA